MVRTAGWKTVALGALLCSGCSVVVDPASPQCEVAADGFNPCVAPLRCVEETPGSGIGRCLRVRGEMDAGACPDGCASGQVCDNGQCVPVLPEAGVDAPPDSCPSICPEGQRCDLMRNQCAEFTGSPLGATCQLDRQCTSDVCADLALVGGSGRQCAQTCCSDADCPEEAVCVAGRSGARLCLLTVRLGWPDKGSKVGGEECSSDSQCISGVCEGGVCLRQCQHDRDCPGQHCRVRFRDDGRAIAACQSAIGLANNQSCLTGDNCESNLCLAASLLDFRCRDLCRDSGDCPGEHCGQAEHPDAPGYVAACLEGGDDEFGATGATCQANVDCRDQMCVDGRCAGTCCRGCVPGYVCRPLGTADRASSHCLPRSP